MLPRLVRHSVWRARDPEQGRGLAVLLVPGFGVGDWSLLPIRTWLTARGYRPETSRTGLNLGCTTALAGQLERRLGEIADRTGHRVVILGQSRGGWLGRLAATRRPDLVRGLVMLASPVLDPLGAKPASVRAARSLTRLAALGVPGVLDDDCFDGDCYRTNRALLTERLPAGVDGVSVYSRRDGVVPWWLCRDPWAEGIEVTSSHTAMGLDPDCYAALEPRLAAWAKDPGGAPAR